MHTHQCLSSPQDEKCLGDLTLRQLMRVSTPITGLFTPSRTLSRQLSGSFAQVRSQHQLAGLSLDFTRYRDVQQNLPLDELNLLFCLKVRIGLVANFYL